MDDSDELAFAHTRARDSEEDHQEIEKDENIPLVPSDKDYVTDKQEMEIQELMDLYKKKEPELEETEDTQEHDHISEGNFTLPSSSKIILPDSLSGKKRIKEILITYKKMKSEREPVNNSEGKRLTCVKCDFSSENHISLKKHILSKHEEIRFQCDKCEKNYSDSSALLRHKKTIHEGVVHKCDVCLQLFSEAGAVTRHKKKFHTTSS